MKAALLLAITVACGCSGEMKEKTCPRDCLENTWQSDAGYSHPIRCVNLTSGTSIIVIGQSDQKHFMALIRHPGEDRYVQLTPADEAIIAEKTE